MGLQLQMSWQPSLLSQKRKNGPPLGLKNLGNSCYLNSVLQCLTYTPPLANFCLNSQHSSLCDSASDTERKRECPFCVLEKQIVRSLSLDLALDTPAKLLRIFAEHFKFGHQEDAHEFLRYVIDACHNTCLRLKKLRRKGSELFNGTTVVKEIFGGALQSQVKCLSCGAESNKIDEIMDISLEILHSSTLKDSMQKFFEPETLDGNNKYRCENCKKLVTARKQMSILEAPNILVIQLKRFEGIFGGKIDKAITFEEVLVLSSFMCKASQDPRPEYSLFGTIVHSGFSPESGHYYAYIKDAMGRWYCCNDLCVSLSTRQEVLSEKVYILFFSRINQRPVSTSTKSASNGVKSRDINGSEISKTQKAAVQLKEVSTRPHVEQSFRKNTSASSKVEKVTSSPRMKFNISGNLGSKKVPPTSNGKLGVQKSQNMVANGVVKSEKDLSSSISKNDSIHMEKSEKDLSSLTSKNGSNMNKKIDAVNGVKSRAFPLAYENGSAHSVGNNSAKPDSDEGKSTSSSSKTGRGPDHHELDNAIVNFHSHISGSKRKSQEVSYILLGRDTQSREKVEELKEILKKEASLVLRSCGWYDKVHSFMCSRKRLCAQEAENAPSGRKKMLVADARSTFNSEIPESLKADLIKRLQSFSQKKLEFLGS